MSENWERIHLKRKMFKIIKQKELCLTFDHIDQNTPTNWQECLKCQEYSIQDFAKTHLFLDCILLHSYSPSGHGTDTSAVENQSSELLKAHLEKYLQYRCSVCKKICTSRKALEMHMNIHTGAKPYICGNCGAKFNHPSNLNRHMKRFHSTNWATAINIRNVRKILAQINWR